MNEDVYLKIALWVSNNTAVVASLAGSFISSGFSSLKTWKERAFCYSAGAMAARYVAPFIDSFLKIGEELSGFLIGVFGLSLCAATLKIITKFGDNADVWSVIKDYISSKISSTKGS